MTLVLLALAELGMAKVVADRLPHRRDRRGRPRGRPLHPMQVARAAVLAKASSVTGAVLLGAYGGLFAWTLPRRDELALAATTRSCRASPRWPRSGWSWRRCVLERACRTPGRADDLECEPPEPTYESPA